MAALAVTAKHYPKGKALVMLYRLAEFAANAICLFGSLWLIGHFTWLVMFLVLWYLPAALRTRSLYKPLRLPILMFVVDDFSLLDLHPTPRGARSMYKVYLSRVLIIIVLIPVLALTIPHWLKDKFSNKNAISIMFSDKRDKIPEVNLLAWTVLSIVMVSLASIWVVATAVMLCRPERNVAGLARQQQEQLVRDIGAIAARIDRALALPGPQSCLSRLRELQAEYPSLKLTTASTTFGPAAGSLVHMLLDIQVAYTFFSKGDVPDYVMGGLTVANLICTLAYNSYHAHGNPFAVVMEAKRSFERGAFTERYVRIMCGDLGAHVLPALCVKIFGLPFCADRAFQVVGAIATLVMACATSVPFIFQQFDLGVEREGYGHNIILTSSEPEGDAKPQAEEGLDFAGWLQELKQRLF